MLKFAAYSIVYSSILPNGYNLKMDVTEQELQMTQEFLNDLLSDTRKESIIRIIGKLR